MEKPVSELVAGLRYEADEETRFAGRPIDDDCGRFVVHSAKAKLFNSAAEALERSPRWHDRPPVPGLYVSWGISGFELQVVGRDDNFSGGRWFGPIPPVTDELRLVRS